MDRSNGGESFLLLREVSASFTGKSHNFFNNTPADVHNSSAQFCQQVPIASVHQKDPNVSPSIRTMVQSKWPLSGSTRPIDTRYESAIFNKRQIVTVQTLFLLNWQSQQIEIGVRRVSGKATILHRKGKMRCIIARV